MPILGRSVPTGTCTYRTDGGAYSEVALPDGRVVASVPHPTAEYEARALALGYGDGAAMAREHDFLHAALAGVFGATSPVLLAVAGGVPIDAWQEDELVKLIASRINDPAADSQPGGGLVAWLRDRLREVEPC